MAWCLVLAGVLFTCAVRGDVNKIQKQDVHPTLLSKKELTPTAVLSRPHIAEGGTIAVLNKAIRLPSKAPVAFTAGTPRHDTGEVPGRKFKKGVLRKVAVPLLILLAVKAGLGFPIVFGIVALAAFKGLWAGSSALFVSAAMALKHMMPQTKVILPAGHAHVQDIYADYRRSDSYYGDDYSGYGHK